MLTFISSMNLKLFDEYGKRFLESWKKNVKNEVELLIFFEGHGIEKIQEFATKDLIKIYSIESDSYSKFRSIYTKFSQSQGVQFQIDANKLLQATYNYRYDAVRFSFKIFSLIKALRDLKIKNNFAWIDSDIVCKKHFSETDLLQFFPPSDCLASYLGRTNFPLPNPYSECGFVGYNFSNKFTNSFIEEFHDLYMTGEIFLLKEWHDCMAFDHLRIKYENMGEKFYNLSAHLMNLDHPFMKTDLSLFFDHLKGPERKKRGFS